MNQNLVQFSNPIKAILHTKEEDNEVIIIGYVNYGYDIILVDENNYIYGACNIRYPLVGNLYNLGGNIGYAIRPNERGKGYGEKLLKLSIDKCRELGLDKILVTVRKNNIQSNELVKKCGGIQETDYLDEASGIMFHRYFINL